MCYKASLFRQYRTVNCIDIGDGTVDLLVIRKGQPDLSVRVSDRSGMAILHIWVRPHEATEEELNKKLVCKLFYSSTVAPDSFWDLLRTPEEYKDELDFYKKENLPEGYVDLPTVVKTISDMVRELPFWCAMVELMNKISSENDSNIVTQKWKELLLKLAKSYVKILEPDAKEKCIEILATLQSN